MSRGLKLYIAGVVVASAIALVTTTFAFPVEAGIGVGFTFAGDNAVGVGLLFWTGLTVIASALPVTMPRGSLVAVSTAPLLAATALGGPAVGGWIALIGVTELREIRASIPWYGTLSNHAGIVLPTILAGVVIRLFGPAAHEFGAIASFVAVMLGSAAFIVVNLTLAATVVSLRSGQAFRHVLLGDARGYGAGLIGLAPLGWLMSQIYSMAWWATLVFAVPLYTTRRAYHNFIEMREMFTQTITALAGAVDKRDPFTSKHSWRVKEIAGDIGRVMRLSETDLEALEWGGLLHDVGKIGVRDDVLLKQDKLTREERIEMNSHPVKGAQIIAPVTRLKRELPIIRHHHEWYNGSGYPDRLIGEEIPILARVLHVADAFEAMTAARPYRMTPLSAEIALGELRRYSGVQFDPKVVDAFVKTKWAAGVPDPGRPEAQRQVPLIGQVASETAAKPADTASPSDTKPAD
jgi:putative nucleotidyltransferase with HDIG domain